MKEKRSIITMDGQGNIALPTDTVSIAMTEWELCELFGVIAPTIRAGIKALCKSGVLREYETKHTIKLSDKRSMEVYSLEAIIALAFRINTFGAEQVRRAILERLYLRKEKTGIFFSHILTHPKKHLFSALFLRIFCFYSPEQPRSIFCCVLL